MDKFIDISHWDGMLNSIVTGTEGGVVIKATEGASYTDPCKELYYKMFKGKVAIGFYHFLSVFSNPTDQAKHFYNSIKKLDYQIIPVLDVEQQALSYKAEQFAITFLKEFKKISGLDCLIYSGESFIKEHFSATFIKNHNFWVAKYSSNKPYINNCNIVAWQYTDKANLRCCNKVDCSYLYYPHQFYIGNHKVYKENVTKYNIKTLQAELNKQGFRSKNKTRLLVDGIAGSRTLSACPTVRINARGNITKWIQHKVGAKIDGIFGNETYTKVRNFQRRCGIHVDGIVGYTTWKYLLKC